jgi:hypothetical protein
MTPADARWIVREPGHVVLAIGDLFDEHAIEEQLDPDVSDRAARSASTTTFVEALVELAHQREDRRQAM